MRIIKYTFFTLIFALPLVLHPSTSELFEFNKLITVYLATIIVSATWGVLMIQEKKIIIKRTYLDVPILLFLTSQLVSTILSIDQRTSLLGYYSRWHGGLLSYLSYAILYWAFVTFINKRDAIRFLTIALVSTAVASVYASLEHFGLSTSCLIITKKFNVDCWVQDVATRVFGTFGQPNWLAAWLVALIPITWGYLLLTKNIKLKVTWFLLFALFSVTLFYTKSRSGILGLASAGLSFWIAVLYLHAGKFKNVIAHILLIAGFLLLISVAVETPWQINLGNKQISKIPTFNNETAVSPALEVGGTASGEIRKIVWTGSYELFKMYPLFGSGVETFAYAYYQARPVEHNLVSEWNFLYNKAHNEYLNFLATTGIFGLSSYLVLILSSLYQILKSLEHKNKILSISLFSGTLSILVTNFFGFSVVPIGIMLFLFPALSVSLQNNKNDLPINLKKLGSNQKILIALIGIVFLYSLYFVFKYWRADFNYAKGVKANRLSLHQESVSHLNKSVSSFPNEPVYREERANSYSGLALLATKSENQDLALSATIEAQKDSLKLLDLSPFNVKLIKSISNVYSDLGKIVPDFRIKELEITAGLVNLAPTDASIQYRYAVALAKNNKVDEAFQELFKTIEMKPNYKLARKLLAYMYLDLEDYESAVEQYEYILKFIDPNDQGIKNDLEEAKGKI